MEGTLSTRLVAREIAIQENMFLMTFVLLFCSLCKMKFDFPTEPRTLMGKPGVIVITNFLNRIYIQFGFEECLQNVLENMTKVRPYYHRIANPRQWSLSSFKVSMQQLWPILGRTIGPKSSAFLKGHFGGNSKPMDMHEFMGHTANDLEFLLRKGIFLRTISRTF